MRSALNIGQIEAFRSVMLAGTVVGAAKLLNVTQPGVSRSIGMLELRIGYKLFERHGRRLVATPEAEAFYREIEPLYSNLDRIAEIAQDIRFQRAGALRIATLPALANGIVPKAVSSFLASRPKIRVTVDSLPSRQIAERLSTRQFDIGIVELPVFRSAITIEPLDSVPLVAVIPPGHRLATKRQITLKDLDGERMVMLSQHSFIRHQIDDKLADLGVAPIVVLETSSSAIACAMAVAGAGIGLVGKLTALPHAGPNLVMLPVKEELDSRYALVFPEEGVRLALANAFADELRNTIRKAGAAD